MSTCVDEIALTRKAAPREKAAGRGWRRAVSLRRLAWALAAFGVSYALHLAGMPESFAVQAGPILTSAVLFGRGRRESEGE